MTTQVRTKAKSMSGGKRLHTAASMAIGNQVARANVIPEASAIHGVFMPAPSSFRLPAVRRERQRNGNRALKPSEAATLYEKATGESPNEVLAVEQSVLVETGVSGCYADFPNGYVPILISRTSDGCVVFDTGQSAPKQGIAISAVMRDGDTLYVRTENEPESLKRGIRTMVSTLRQLHEGL